MAKAKVVGNKQDSKIKGAKNTKKGGAKKGHAQTAAALAQPCLSLAEAAFIVGGCLPPGTHTNDDTLEEAGLITPPLRQIFRECVFNGVLAAGCDIDKGQIPNAADTKIGAVVQAVFQNSR